MKRLPACVALVLWVAAALPTTASARWASHGDWGGSGLPRPALWGGPRFFYPGYYAVHPEYGGCWRWSRYPWPHRVSICY